MVNEHTVRPVLRVNMYDETLFAMVIINDTELRLLARDTELCYINFQLFSMATQTGKEQLVDVTITIW
jgi:hypothetical protein